MDGKPKVSFGIKFSKQGNLAKKGPETKTDVEYINSVDGTFKPLGTEKPKEELIIPSKGNKSSKEFIEELQAEKSSANVPGDVKQSLEQLAVKEIIDETKGAINSNKKESLVVPLPQDSDAKESSLEDYESIPVEHFGKAMLRGMGWKPGAGIGKNQKIVAPVETQLRPKGMGLGADKMAVTNPVGYCSSTGKKDELTLGNGSNAQITAGPSSGLYGKIVSHNEDTGRCIVKLELGGSTVSVNENFVKAVTKEDYTANSRVLNAEKFKKYSESMKTPRNFEENNFIRRHKGNSPEPEKRNKEPVLDAEKRKKEFPSDSERRNREFPSDSDRRNREFPSDSDRRNREFPSDSDRRNREFPSDSDRRNREYSTDSDRRNREFSSDSDRRNREYSSNSDRRNREFTSDSRHRKRYKSRSPV